MRSRSRLTTTAIALLSILVISAGLAWACTPASGGVDESSGGPGDQTTYTGRQFVPGEPLEVRWNDAFENDPNAPLMTVAQADANGMLKFTVTIPEAEPGHYWIVVIGPGNGGEGGTRFRGSADYTIEGAAAEEPPAEEPAEEPAQEPAEEPQGSNEPAPSGQETNEPAARNDERSDSRSRVPSVTAADLKDTDRQVAAFGYVPPSYVATLASEGPVEPSRLPFRVLRLDPSMDGVGPWTGDASADPDRAPSLVAVSGPTQAPLSQFAVGAALLGVGLVAMFAGFFVAEIRRQRRAEVAVDADPTDLTV